MKGTLLERLPRPLAMLLRLLWALMLSAAALVLGNLLGKRLLEPEWEVVISYTGSLSFVCLLLANPLLGFLLWVVTAPFFGFAHLHISLGRGIPDLSLSRLVLALLVALLAAQIATGRRSMARLTWVDLFAVLAMLGVGQSILYSESTSASLAWFFESFLMPVITYFVARNLITDARKLIGAQRALVMVGVLIALVVIQEQLMGYSWFPVEGSTAYGQHLRRATGLLGNPAFTGVIIAMTLPFVWRAYLQNERRAWRRLLLICLGIMYVGLYLTYNRTAWAGGVVGLLIFFLFYPRFRRPFLKLVPFLAIFVVIYWAQISTSYAFTERLVSMNPITTRLETYRLALRVIASNPWGGLGFGNLWQIEELATPHNTYLWVLLTAGLLGFIPYVGTFVLMALRSLGYYRHARAGAGTDRTLVVAFWAALVAYLGQVFAVDMLYGIYVNIIFFFIAGAVLGQQQVVEEAARQQPDVFPSALEARWHADH